MSNALRRLADHIDKPVTVSPDHGPRLYGWLRRVNRNGVSVEFLDGSRKVVAAWRVARLRGDERDFVGAQEREAAKYE